MDWSSLYPDFIPSQDEDDKKDTSSSSGNTSRPRVEVADIGCGFGGLLIALAPAMPETLILGEFVSRAFEGGFSDR